MNNASKQNALLTLVIALQLFQKSQTEETTIQETKALDEETTDFNRIRCPLCKWKPGTFSRWVCSYCPSPENFYDGCGTIWNTFDTHGLCPGCNHQWRWTGCLACHRWSLHEDWYVQD